MKLVMTLLVRDSADIIATNIEYHLARGVDYIIATDNLSADGTRDILERYGRLGVLHLLLETDDTYAQHKWVTRMARLAQSDFGADWVINNDDDEFWWPEGGSLKDVLADAPPDAIAVMAPRHNFIPRPQTDAASFVETMTIREVESFNALGKALPGKVCHRALADIYVAQGNHIVLKDGVRLQPITAPLTILHFPLRTYTQFSRRIQVGGAALERNTELKLTSVATWRMLYEKLKAGELEEYYRSQELDRATIDRRLAEGRLVIDERLRDYVRQHGIPAEIRQ